MKCKEIKINGGSGYYPHPNSAELDTPYFRQK